MNYLLIVITILFLSVLIYLSINHKESFITYIKDKQLIGTIDKAGMEDNKYPLSSTRSDRLRRNEEQCYGTLNVPANQITKNNRGLCLNNGSARKKTKQLFRNNRILEGERAPSIGMYAIDFSNYETYYEREIKGKPLTGQITAGNMVLTLSSQGQPSEMVSISSNGISTKETPKRLTLSKVKSICDELGSSCAGFTVFTPTDDRPDSVATFFYSSIEQDRSDIYSLDYEYRNLGNLSQNKEAKYLKNNKGAISFIKKNPEYIEKPIVKLDTGSVKYTKLNCNVKQNENFMYYNMNGTLDQCKSKCKSLSNPDCIGFSKNIKNGEDSSSSCVFHKGNELDYMNSMISAGDCPEGFDKKTDREGYCVKPNDSKLPNNTLIKNCRQSGGTPNPSSGNIQSCIPTKTEKLCLPSKEFAVYKREFDN